MRLLFPRWASRGALLACAATAGGCEYIVGTDAIGRPYPVAREPAGDAGTDADPSACSHTRECVERLGEHHLCRRDRATCVPLFSEHCREVIGDYTNDGALLLGSIGPTEGPNASTGLSNLWGIKLAVEDFTVIGNGLPPVPSTGRRPIVVVHCDDGASSDQAVTAARHLTADLGVSAIIGPSFSGITAAVVSQVAVPAGVLVMSPSATSASLTDLPDDDLLWRTAPSDAIQAQAQVLLIAKVREIIRQRQRIMSGYPMKLAVLHKGDPYGIGLAEDVARTLIWNEGSASSDPNAPYVKRFNYGDPGNVAAAPTQYDLALAKVLELEPHLVLLYGTGEVAILLQMIEDAWDEETQPRPHYVFADGAVAAEVSEMIAALDPDGSRNLADRVFGTEPGFLGSNYELFEQLYVSRADAPHVPITFGSANSYDALYVLAYASVVAGKAHPSGSDLAMGISHLVPGPGVPLTDVGATRINATFRELSSGGRVDLSGASGPLDFDLATGDVASGILLWCAQVQADGSVKLVPTFETYDPKLDDLVRVGETEIRCGQYPLPDDPGTILDEVSLPQRAP